MTEHESKKAKYQAAVDKLCLLTEIVREELAARAAAVAPSVPLPPLGPPPTLMTMTPAWPRSLPTSGSSESSSAPFLLPERRVPTNIRDIDNLLRRLRANSSRELFPGQTAGQVADDLVEQTEEIEILKAIRRYLEEFYEFLDVGMAVIEAALTPRALEAYHEVRRLSRLPGGSEYGLLARKMKQALRARQPNPRGRRTARSVGDRNPTPTD